MKKILLFIAVIALLASCTVTQGEEPVKVTQKGLLIYAITSDEVISQYILGLDNALKVNELVNASEEKRDSLEDLYFYDCIIREVGDTCRLRSYADIVMDEHSITDAGAHWQYLCQNMKMDIYNAGENTYTIKTSDTQQPGVMIHSSAELSVTVTPLKESEKEYNSVYEYSVTGSGSYIESIDEYYSYSQGASIRLYNQTNTVKYSITSPLGLSLYPFCYYPYPGAIGYLGLFLYYTGGIHMTLSGTAIKTQEEIIEAKLSYNYANKDQIIYITYDGVTETW